MRGMLLMLLAACSEHGQSPAMQPADASDGPTVFVDAPPDEPACSPCEILSQCGCGMGMACDKSDTVPVCRADGGGQLTTACADDTDCDGGFTCLGGACKRYCDDAADCVAPRGKCVLTVPNAPNACSSNCDPSNIATGGCPANFRCSFLTAAVDCVAVTTAGGNGANCKSGVSGDDRLCAANFTCISADGNATFQCRRVCNKTANTGCTSGSCTGFGTPLIIGGTEYGVCL